MLRGIAVDVDPDGNLEATEAGRVAEQARLDALVSEWIATGVTAVVHSGGGRQGFWFFPESTDALHAGA